MNTYMNISWILMTVLVAFVGSIASFLAIFNYLQLKQNKKVKAEVSAQFDSKKSNASVQYALSGKEILPDAEQPQAPSVEVSKNSNVQI